MNSNPNISRAFYTLKSMLVVSHEGNSIWFNISKAIENKKNSYDTQNRINIKFNIDEIGKICHILRNHLLLGEKGFLVAWNDYKAKDNDKDKYPTIKFYHASKNDEKRATYVNFFLYEKIRPVFSFTKSINGKNDSIQFSVLKEFEYSFVYTLEMLMSRTITVGNRINKNEDSQNSNESNSDDFEI